jgi:transcriptional repressor NrdR
MRCPFCKGEDSKVLDSRESMEGVVTRRRRQCLECNKRFTTYERIEELAPLVVKKDGRREPFDRDKLLGALQKAVAKRPVSMDQLEGLVVEVEARLQERGEKEVPSHLIGEEVMRRLRAVDQVAYVRFASVYRSFRDIEEFMDELKGLLDDHGPEAARRKRGRADDSAS